MLLSWGWVLWEIPLDVLGPKGTVVRLWVWDIVCLSVSVCMCVQSFTFIEVALLSVVWEPAGRVGGSTRVCVSASPPHHIFNDTRQRVCRLEWCLVWLEMSQRQVAKFR